MKKTFKSKKIFIAGHKGMVGSALCSYLRKMNFNNIITASRSKLDLTDSDKVQKFIKRKKPNVVINCAGKVGGIMANYNFPTQFLLENIKIQINLAESCFKNNIENVIFLGSSCIYPKFAKQPIKEEYLLNSKLEPTNEAYALAKIIGLKSLEYYNRQFNKNYITLMPCNMYGPNDNFDLKNSHFIPALIKKFYKGKIKKKKIIEIWGTGKARREIMHVEDLADAIFFILIKLLKEDKKLKKNIKKNPFINVGTGIDHSIKFYASVIQKIIYSKSKIKFNKKFPDGTPRKLLNNSVIYKMGWKPKISIIEGLKSTYEWYKKN